jgi:hypothetical protein
MSVEIRLSRMDRVYHPGQMLKGVATVHSRGSSLQHDGIGLTAEGSASLQLSAKSVGLFEAFYSSIKPVQLMCYQHELQPPGKLPSESVEFPFEIELQPLSGEKLHESYHGVFVNLQYVLTVEVRRGMLAKNIKRSIEFIVEAVDSKPHKDSPAPFSIVPESLENVRKSALHQVPSFKIRGQLDSVVCNLAQPLTGEVVIEECSATIKSIELQLVRCAHAPLLRLVRILSAHPPSRWCCRCVSRRARTRTGWLVRRPRSKTSKSPTAPCATDGLSLST